VCREGGSYISQWARIHFNLLEEVVGIPFIFRCPQQAEESQSSLFLSCHFPYGEVTASFVPYT